eukprot:CAMPEP_0114515908 /NCGR_PEP_ID=MMETSP0109-20121206/17026_1 /TAXON_ID=29199 /ORGANISM="Chlorarachnion reptans, Strain CCCM449" /LENGTH=242 /DNA_ID=CAMNT_0001696223 /DNA_START=192 /DNA_END=920 /DNA_ORIENTATION=-
MEEAKKAMQACIDSVKTGTDRTVYYGFTIKEDSDEFMCREGYKDAAGLIAHFSDVKEALQKAHEVADVKSVDCIGPKAELEKLKKHLDALGGPTKMYFTTLGKSLSSLPFEGKKDAHVSVQPRLTVKEGKMDEMKKFLAETVDITAKGTKLNMYYGYYISGNTVRCREGYVNAEGLLSHMGEVGAVLAKAMPLCETMEMGVHATAGEIKKCKEHILKAMPMTTFWELLPGAVTGNAIETIQT